MRGQEGNIASLCHALVWAGEVVVQMGLGATSCQWWIGASLPTV